MVFGEVYSVLVLGHSDGAIGTPLDNVITIAILELPMDLVIAIGYLITPSFELKTVGKESQPLHWVIVCGLVAGGLVFVWGLVAPALYDVPIANFGGLTLYCFLLGCLSGYILSRFRSGTGLAA